MKAIVVISSFVLLFNLVVSELTEKDWEQFKLKYQKNYLSAEEEDLRKSVWIGNSKFIEEHNVQADKKVHQFYLAMNQFGDLTAKEFADFVASRNNGVPRNLNLVRSKSQFKNNYIPEQLDWRSSGCVLPVRDQGQGCNDEYAFNVGESIAGAKCVLTRDLKRLSEQQIIDCSQSFGNLGCQGGFYDQSYKYIIKSGGLELEKDYPYEGVDGQCRFDDKKISVSIKDYVDVQAGNETELTFAIANVGPIPVAIDASQPTFQFYSSGIYYDAACSSSNVDHLVLIIGYGFTPKAQQFYVVKNSWGINWGDKGYIRMSRYRNNNCGIASFASYPVL